LLPPASAGGAWTEEVLWSFIGRVQGDGMWPANRVLLDADGAVYGTTTKGGSANFGTVFRLAPPAAAGGAWTQTIVNTFCSPKIRLASIKRNVCGDGFEPETDLAIDEDGTLYLPAQEGLKFTPPAPSETSWGKSIIADWRGYYTQIVHPTDGSAPS